MPREFHSLADLLNHGFDTVIDVRSPAEFALDHIPGAMNMPALTNEQRAEVGTLYMQISAFEAKKIGAAMVARNAADAIEQHMADRDGSWRPLVYCWRGGQRSGSFASILAQIGWRTDKIKGGYQAYRRLVHRVVYDDPLPHRLILIDGYTGTAKSDILRRLPDLGVQMLDLEGLAHHRGSLLGGFADDQPNQKAFESAIACALVRLDPALPVVVEAESSKIGKLIVPPSIWAAMCAGPRIEITAPLGARAEYLVDAYADVIAEPEALKRKLQPIRQHRGHETVNRWEALLEEGRMTDLAAALMADHYDPAYAKSRAVHAPERIGTVAAESLDAASLDKAAQEVAEIVRSA